eukprot:GEMP01000283.1.p1 GENE.GEMP01000283.1~~GEMP01000283.1.p1  ORF type:complete len:2171 (+),score=470.81 GEMP01000283.1:72-6584(+)
MNERQHERVSIVSSARLSHQSLSSAVSGGPRTHISQTTTVQRSHDYLKLFERNVHRKQHQQQKQQTISRTQSQIAICPQSEEMATRNHEKDFVSYLECSYDTYRASFIAQQCFHAWHQHAYERASDRRCLSEKRDQMLSVRQSLETLWMLRSRRSNTSTVRKAFSNWLIIVNMRQNAEYVFVKQMRNHAARVLHGWHVAVKSYRLRVQYGSSFSHKLSDARLCMALKTWRMVIFRRAAAMRLIRHVLLVPVNMSQVLTSWSRRCLGRVRKRDSMRNVAARFIGLGRTSIPVRMVFFAWKTACQWKSKMRGIVSHTATRNARSLAAVLHRVYSASAFRAIKSRLYSDNSERLAIENRFLRAQVHARECHGTRRSIRAFFVMWKQEVRLNKMKFVLAPMMCDAATRSSPLLALSFHLWRVTTSLRSSQKVDSVAMPRSMMMAIHSERLDAHVKVSQAVNARRTAHLLRTTLNQWFLCVLRHKRELRHTEMDNAMEESHVRWKSMKKDFLFEKMQFAFSWMDTLVLVRCLYCWSSLCATAKAVRRTSVETSVHSQQLWQKWPAVRGQNDSGMADDEKVYDRTDGQNLRTVASKAKQKGGKEMAFEEERRSQRQPQQSGQAKETDRRNKVDKDSAQYQNVKSIVHGLQKTEKCAHDMTEVEMHELAWADELSKLLQVDKNLAWQDELQKLAAYALHEQEQQHQGILYALPIEHPLAPPSLDFTKANVVKKHHIWGSPRTDSPRPMASETRHSRARSPNAHRHSQPTLRTAAQKSKRGDASQSPPPQPGRFTRTQPTPGRTEAEAARVSELLAQYGLQLDGGPDASTVAPIGRWNPDVARVLPSSSSSLCRPLDRPRSEVLSPLCSVAEQPFGHRETALRRSSPERIVCRVGIPHATEEGLNLNIFQNVPAANLGDWSGKKSAPMNIVGKTDRESSPADGRRHKGQLSGSASFVSPPAKFDGNSSAVRGFGDNASFGVPQVKLNRNSNTFGEGKTRFSGNYASDDKAILSGSPRAFCPAVPTKLLACQHSLNSTIKPLTKDSKRPLECFEMQDSPIQATDVLLPCAAHGKVPDVCTAGPARVGQVTRHSTVLESAPPSPPIAKLSVNGPGASTSTKTSRHTVDGVVKNRATAKRCSSTETSKQHIPKVGVHSVQKSLSSPPSAPSLTPSSANAKLRSCSTSPVLTTSLPASSAKGEKTIKHREKDVPSFCGNLKCMGSRERTPSPPKIDGARGGATPPDGVRSARCDGVPRNDNATKISAPTSFASKSVSFPLLADSTPVVANALSGIVIPQHAACPPDRNMSTSLQHLEAAKAVLRDDTVSPRLREMSSSTTFSPAGNVPNTNDLSATTRVLCPRDQSSSSPVPGDVCSQPRRYSAPAHAPCVRSGFPLCEELHSADRKPAPLGTMPNFSMRGCTGEMQPSCAVKTLTVAPLSVTHHHVTCARRHSPSDRPTPRPVSPCRASVTHGTATPPTPFRPRSTSPSTIHMATSNVYDAAPTAVTSTHRTAMTTPTMQSALFSDGTPDPPPTLSRASIQHSSTNNNVGILPWASEVVYGTTSGTFALPRKSGQFLNFPADESLIVVPPDSASARASVSTEIPVLSGSSAALNLSAETDTRMRPVANGDKFARMSDEYATPRCIRRDRRARSPTPLDEEKKFVLLDSKSVRKLKLKKFELPEFSGQFPGDPPTEPEDKQDNIRDDSAVSIAKKSPWNVVVPLPEPLELVRDPTHMGIPPNPWLPEPDNAVSSPNVPPPGASPASSVYPRSLHPAVSAMSPSSPDLAVSSVYPGTEMLDECDAHVIVPPLPTHMLTQKDDGGRAAAMAKEKTITSVAYRGDRGNVVANKSTMSSGTAADAPYPASRKPPSADAYYYYHVTAAAPPNAQREDAYWQGKNADGSNYPTSKSRQDHAYYRWRYEDENRTRRTKDYEAGHYGSSTNSRTRRDDKEHHDSSTSHARSPLVESRDTRGMTMKPRSSFHSTTNPRTKEHVAYYVPNNEQHDRATSPPQHINTEYRAGHYVPSPWSPKTVPRPTSPTPWSPRGVLRTPPLPTRKLKNSEAESAGRKPEKDTSSRYAREATMRRSTDKNNDAPAPAEVEHARAGWKRTNNQSHRSGDGGGWENGGWGGSGNEESQYQVGRWNEGRKSSAEKLDAKRDNWGEERWRYWGTSDWAGGHWAQG